MIDFWHILLPVIAAIVTAPLSAWLMSKLLKSKHEAEIAKLKTEVEQMRSDVRSRELDNDKKAITMIMELVVEPLRIDMIALQNSLKRFTNAIKKITSCPYADTCPVSRELQNSAADSCTGTEAPARKRKGARATNTPPARAGEPVTVADDSPTAGGEPPDGGE
ncbi:MAG: hypothetical protein ACI4BD_05895 [Paludibacteraceae bacterium]